MLGVIKKYWFYTFLFIILTIGLILRIYNIGNLLGFYYDQGRDALVIWDFLYNGKLFLIGPTTGLAGIFRGPFYYYLIAPFYWIGKGNPVYPSVFLSLTTIFAAYLSYYLTSKFLNKAAGIISAILISFSFQIILASRWLSNPTPMMLFSMLLVFAMWKVTEEKKKYWYLISLILGLSFFSFGSSGEAFYFPAVGIFALWQRKTLSLKTIIISAIIFGITFLPQVVFDIRHDGILRQGIAKHFVEEKSFTMTTKYLLENRTRFYYDVFTSKIFHSRGKYELIALTALVFIAVFNFKKIFKSKGGKVFLLLLASPLIGLYFYQGNYTVLYDYYMTGYYLIFLSIVGLILGSVWGSNLGKVFILIFLYLFITNNYPFIRYKFTDKSDGPNSISLVNQKNVTQYIKEDSGTSKFNVDVYVPPVIPYAYDYLFKWQNLGQVNEDVPLLYTVYEKDEIGKDRLDAWLARQNRIGKVNSEKEFGGIVVQKRIRYE